MTAKSLFKGRTARLEVVSTMRPLSLAEVGGVPDVPDSTVGGTDDGPKGDPAEPITSGDVPPPVPPPPVPPPPAPPAPPPPPALPDPEPEPVPPADEPATERVNIRARRR